MALADHHCHGVIRRDVRRGEFEAMLTEADHPGQRGAPGLTMFDSQIGLAVRRWCPPVLGLPAHTEPDEYLDRRAALGHAEVSRRFLRAAGLAELYVDTGFEPEPLLSPPEMAAVAGGQAHEIVRLEQVAESVAAAGIRAAAFAGAFRETLANRARHAAGVKSVAAYRVGLDLPAARPTDAEVAAAAARWLGCLAPAGSSGDSESRLRGLRVLRVLRVLRRLRETPGCRLPRCGGRGAAASRSGPAHLPDLVRRRPRAAHPVPRGLRRPRHRPAPVQPAAADRPAAGHRARRGAVMLLHNYPYHREAGYLAQVFPHVYMDAGLATHNLGHLATALIAECLELAPFGKFLYAAPSPSRQPHSAVKRGGRETAGPSLATGTGQQASAQTVRPAPASL